WPVFLLPCCRLSVYSQARIRSGRGTAARPAASHVMNQPTSDQATAARAGRSSEKYQRILEAAILVIAEKGFFQARVSEIADQAGVADGTIYLYFKKQEQILLAAIDAAFGVFLERARAELAGNLSPREQLACLARLHLEGLGANRPLAVVFQTELRH